MPVSYRGWTLDFITRLKPFGFHTYLRCFLRKAGTIIKRALWKQDPDFHLTARQIHSVLSKLCRIRKSENSVPRLKGTGKYPDCPGIPFFLIPDFRTVQHVLFAGPVYNSN